MEEILRDSEKDQNNALQEGSSDACSQAAGNGSADQTNQPSLHLVLDPSATGIDKMLPHLIFCSQSYMAVLSFKV